MEKSKIVAIHQPNYFPWLGYFYKIYQCDTFVFLDDVQFSNEGMHNYHYIKTPNGSLRLKIPVEQHLGDKILNVKTKDNLGWKEKHLKTIEANYKKSANFKQIYDDYRNLILQNYANIAQMNAAIIQNIASQFGFTCTFLASSDMNIDSQHEEKVLKICQLTDADVYYSGTGAKAYQDEDDFTRNGLELRYSTFQPFDYDQLWGNFQSNVSIIDYLMNCGYDWQRVLDYQK